jgi:Tfp pilus assembly protein PilO
MKLLRLKPNKRSILALAGVLLLLVAASVGLFLKQQSSLAAVQAEYAAKKKQLDEGNALASRLESTLKLLEEDRAQLKFLEAALPSVAYVPTLLRQVEDLARETNNTVRGVRPRIEVKAPTRKERRSDPEAAAKAESADAQKAEEKKEPEPYDKLKIQLTLTGEYKDCLLFIQRLTRFPKIVAVDDLSLRPKFDKGDSAGPNPKIDVDLNLTAYILQEKAGEKLPEFPEEGQAT